MGIIARDEWQTNAKLQPWFCFILTVPRVSMVSLGELRYEGQARRGISSMTQMVLYSGCAE